MSTSSRFRNLGAALAGLLSGFSGLGGPASAHGQSVTPAEAPSEWVAYAQTATQSITRWLEEDSEAAIAFRAYLNQTRAADDQPARPLVLKVWIEANGRISRLGFAPFAHEAANAGLRGLLVGRSLAAPPSGMLLPLRLSVQTEAQAPPEPAADGEAAAR